MGKYVLRRKGATLYAPSQDWADLLAELLLRGYSKDDIKYIAGINVLPALRRAEKIAKDLQAATPIK